MADELGIRAAALFDGDKPTEYKKAREDWRNKPNIGVFQLFKDDIRDKANDTIEVNAKEGVFDGGASFTQLPRRSSRSLSAPFAPT